LKKNETKKASSREDAIVEHHAVSNRSLAKPEAAVNQEMKFALLTLRTAAGMIWSKKEWELSALFHVGRSVWTKLLPPKLQEPLLPSQPVRKPLKTFLIRQVFEWS
jgi:hypothetical protein